MCRSLAKADYQNVRARRRERAEPERACMMWYRAVAHVSLYFFCLYSLSLPLVSAASALPSIRPSVRSALPPSAASREFRITPTSVRGSTGTDPPTDWRRRLCVGRRRSPRPSAFVLCGFIFVIISSSVFRLPPIVPPAAVQLARARACRIIFHMTRDSDLRTEPVSKDERGRLGTACRPPSASTCQLQESILPVPSSHASWFKIAAPPIQNRCRTKRSTRGAEKRTHLRGLATREHGKGPSTDKLLHIHPRVWSGGGCSCLISPPNLHS